MKNIFKLSAIIAAVAAAFTLASCSNEELDTDQYSTKAVLLQAYGPQPVVRGGLLRFVGSNLDQVATVSIPGVAPLTPEVVTSGVHSEIRVTVPKDGPEIGYPVLTLKDGTTLTGKTILSYSEPITIESFSPAAALPGEVVTIKGDYLNNIHEVIFTDKVKVSEKAFTAHDRYAISVVVPETAQTGKIGLGTVDELAVEGTENEANLLATLNIVETETEFVVTTAEGAVAETTLKAGQKVVINGTNLKLAKSIKLAGATLTEFAATDTKIEFELPATVTDGDVVLVMASGVEVVAGTLTTVVPTEVAVSPKPVKNGAVLTITGKDLDLVASVDFPKVTGAEFALADGKITLTVPEKAQEGDVTLNLANGKSVAAAYTLVKPVVTKFSANPASAGSDLTVEGTDLDLVATVTFAGDFKVELQDGATATSFTVAVPTAAETGKLTLNLKNGATVETGELAIDKPAGAYIAVFPEEVLKIGDMFIAELINAEHLTAVKIDDVEVNYILAKNTLYVAVPETAKAGSQLTLVSDNGSVTYTMNIDPGTEASFVIWSGNEDLGSWSNQPYVGEFGFFQSHPEFAEGDVITFSIVPNGDWWQMQIYDGNWGGQVCTPPTSETCPDGVFKLELTQALIDKLNGLDNWGGLFVVQGENCSIVQITATHYIPQETVIWEGNEDLGSWSNQPYVGEFGALTKYGIAAGSRARFYVTPNSDWWQMQIYDGNWGGQLCTPPTSETCPEGVFEFTLDQTMIDKLNGLDNWGGLFVVQGENCTITKVSIIHLVK